MTSLNLNSSKQQNKKTFEHYAKMAHERNHELINVSNTKTPSQGKLTVFCKTCSQEFTTSAKSYEKARVTGCANCKAIKARNQKDTSKREYSSEDKQITTKKI